MSSKIEKKRKKFKIDKFNQMYSNCTQNWQKNLKIQNKNKNSLKYDYSCKKTWYFSQIISKTDFKNWNENTYYIYINI